MSLLALPTIGTVELLFIAAVMLFMLGATVITLVFVTKRRVASSRPVGYHETRQEGDSSPLSRTAFDVSVDHARLNTGEPCLSVMIQNELYELTMWMKHDEVEKLTEIQKANWDERATIQAGVSVNAPVYWVCNNQEVSILVGHDDETWDFAALVPFSIVQQIINKAEALDEIKAGNPSG